MSYLELARTEVRELSSVVARRFVFLLSVRASIVLLADRAVLANDEWRAGLRNIAFDQLDVVSDTEVRSSRRNCESIWLAFSTMDADVADRYSSSSYFAVGALGALYSCADPKADADQIAWSVDIASDAILDTVGDAILNAGGMRAADIASLSAGKDRRQSSERWRTEVQQQRSELRAISVDPRVDMAGLVGASRSVGRELALFRGLI